MINTQQQLQMSNINSNRMQQAHSSAPQIDGISPANSYSNIPDVASPTTDNGRPNNLQQQYMHSMYQNQSMSNILSPPQPSQVPFPQPMSQAQQPSPFQGFPSNNLDVSMFSQKFNSTPGSSQYSTLGSIPNPSPNMQLLMMLQQQQQQQKNHGQLESNQSISNSRGLVGDSFAMPSNIMTQPQLSSSAQIYDQLLQQVNASSTPNQQHAPGGLAQLNSSRFIDPQPTANSYRPNPNVPQSQMQPQNPNVPSQHMAFVSSYSQMHDNLNHYKQLIGFLDSMEQNKKTQSNPAQQQQQQMNPQLQYAMLQQQMVQQQQLLQQTQQNHHQQMSVLQDNNSANMYDINQMQQMRNKQGLYMTSNVSEMLQGPKPQQTPIVPGTGPTELGLTPGQASFYEKDYEEKENLLNDKSPFQPSYKEDQGYIEERLNAIAQDIHRIQNNNTSNTEEEITAKFHNNSESLGSNVVMPHEDLETNQAMNYSYLNQSKYEEPQVNKSAEFIRESFDDNVDLKLSQKSNIQTAADTSPDVVRSNHDDTLNDGDLSHGKSQDLQSNEDRELASAEVLTAREDKPIANTNMTFEQLLEQKLREESQQLSSPAEPFQRNAAEKREFLRKNSSSRAQPQQSSAERQKLVPKVKYEYYADNFSQSTSNANTSPRATTTPQQRKPAQKTSHTPTLQHSQTQKQTQAHAKTATKKPRPPSQQAIASSQQQIAKNSNFTPLRTRSTQAEAKTPITAANLQQINQVTANTRNTQGDDEEEKNSVLEFEMLEKECNKKMEESKRKKSVVNPSKSQKTVTRTNAKPRPSQITPQQQVETKSSDSASQGSKKSYLEPKQDLRDEFLGVTDPKKSKAKDLDTQKQLKELDCEIEKFQRENLRVQRMQEDCSAQLQRLTSEWEDFEERKIKEIQELKQWKDQEIDDLRVQKDQQDFERKKLQGEKEDFSKELSLVKKSENEEILRLNEVIRKLKEDNFDTSERLQFFEDRELRIGSCQTDPPPVLKEVETNTDQVVLEMPVQPSEVIDTNPDIMSPTSQGGGQQDFVVTENEDQEQIPEVDDEFEEDDDEEEEDEYDLKFPEQYHSKKEQKVIDEVIGHDGKVQRMYESGKKEVIFTNGVKREVWPDGYSIVYFNNKDIKQTYPDGKIVYFFSEAKTNQTTFPNGLQVFKFANSQIEKHFVDGTKEISFPDGTIKCLFPDGEEESIFPDGTIQKVEKTGVKTVEFPNGQRDTLYPDGTKMREFEDGSVRKIYPDGKQTSNIFFSKLILALGKYETITEAKKPAK